MKIEVLNRNNQKLIHKDSLDKDLLNVLTYKDNNVSNNKVCDALIGINGNKIINYCIISGTHDTKLFNLKIKNLLQKSFVEQCIDYVFSILYAQNISIFSNDVSKELLYNLGFEYLGKHQGINAFIKDRQIKQAKERSK